MKRSSLSNGLVVENVRFAGRTAPTPSQSRGRAKSGWARSPGVATLLALATLVVLAPPTVSAATIRVPTDYTTIQAAVIAAGAGDKILISDGTYYENVMVSAKTDLTIKGSGKVVIENGVGTGFWIQNCQDVKVKQMQVKNGSGQGIQIDSSLNVTIQDCKLKHLDSTAIDVDLGYGIKIEGCTIKHCLGHGVALYAAGSLIEDNVFEDISSSAIFVTGEQNTIRGNTIEDQGDDAMELGDTIHGCEWTLVQDNTIDGGLQDAIDLRSDADNTVVLENTISGMGWTGIDVNTGADGAVVYGNLLKDSDDEGICWQAVGGLVAENTIKRMGGPGLRVGSYSDDTLLLHNVVTDSSSDGVRVDGTGNCFVQNEVSGSASYDLRDNTSAGDNLYLDNSFGTTFP